MKKFRLQTYTWVSPERGEAIREMASDKDPVRRECLESDHKELQGLEMGKGRMTPQKPLGRHQKSQEDGVGEAKGEESVRKERKIFLRTEKCSLHLAIRRAVFAEQWGRQPDCSGAEEEVGGEENQRCQCFQETGL